MTTCGCGETIGNRSKSGRCGSCSAQIAAKRRYINNDERAKMSAVKISALQDAEKRKRVADAARKNLILARAAINHGSQRRVRGFLGKVPESRRAEYLRLRKSGRMSAEEAYRMIEDDERQKVKRRMGLASEPKTGA